MIAHWLSSSSIVFLQTPAPCRKYQTPSLNDLITTDLNQTDLIKTDLIKTDLINVQGRMSGEVLKTYYLGSP
jgi:hypothetical protein